MEMNMEFEDAVALQQDEVIVALQQEVCAVNEQDGSFDDFILQAKALCMEL